MAKQLTESRKEMEEYYNSPAAGYDYIDGQLLKKEDKDFRMQKCTE